MIPATEELHLVGTKETSTDNHPARWSLSSEMGRVLWDISGETSDQG